MAAAMTSLPRPDARCDAGCWARSAPARNPDMWQPALYAQLARLSAPSATLATFTGVGEVRRGLQAVGFEMRKVKGYGRKREMLCGTLAGAGAGAADWSAPWLARPESPA